MTKLRLLPLLLVTVAATTVACGVEDEAADSTEDALVKLDPKLEAAALANLKRIAKEIDANHLKNYGALPAANAANFGDATAKAFLDAVKLEYEATPALLKKRVETLASMVFFSAPEVTTDPAVGHVTPFHGMDDTAFEHLMTNEDFVFNNHMSANGHSPNGVRPFSVCETKYMIGISKGEIADATFTSDKEITNYDKYAAAFGKYAASCAPADLAEWYNFRGLGGLRPSWLESNFNDRVLRRMLKVCKKGAATPECKDFNKNRLAFRDRKNVAMALREMVFDTDPSSKIGATQDGDYMTDPNNEGVFVDDRNGDGVAEWLVPGPVATLVPGAEVKIGNDKVKVSEDGRSLIIGGKPKLMQAANVLVNKDGEFGGNLSLEIIYDDGSDAQAVAGAGAIPAISRVDSKWNKAYASLPDLGLMKLFDAGPTCTADKATDDGCPLVRRFYSLIDRHEDFYQTYSSMDSWSANISAQPSPLVACSVTLEAAHQWDTAGTPDGGKAGFIYLMRIPFAEILSGDNRSIDTLGRLKGSLTAGPKITTIQSLYKHEAPAALDMTKVWLDIATLSNNQYASEHEISKFGTVPAEQIEGVLVIRRPAAM